MLRLIAGNFMSKRSDPDVNYGVALASGLSLGSQDAASAVPGHQPGSFDVVSAGDIMAGLIRGESALLYESELWHSQSALLASSISRRIKASTEVNVYVSPPGSIEALTLHHDATCVLILQTTGTKEWEVFEPVMRLPSSNEDMASYNDASVGQQVPPPT